MRGLFYKVGKFYTRLIINNIGIFIFVGMLSVIFGDYGWFPNKDMYAISQLAYQGILPVLISYEGGRAIAGPYGGVLSALGSAGMLAADVNNGLWGAMLMGPAAGFVWKLVYERWAGRVKAGLQMLFRNLCVAVLALVLAGAGFFCVSPLLELLAAGLFSCVEFLAGHGLMGVLSILTEPAKVFFLNNLMNHGIFIPIGMEQAQSTGHSLFFLLETNPGPGMGLLLALMCRNKKRRSEYGAALFTQAVGGLHEVYFPYVLSDLRLLLPLIAGGMAGNVVFQFLDAGLQGAVSPGSLITIFLMAGKGEILPVLAGIAVSAAVSFGGSLLMVKDSRGSVKIMQEKKEEVSMKNRIQEAGYEKNRKIDGMQEVGDEKIRKIAVVCDGGVGTSAMGAALLRRKFSQEKITDVSVEAWAADLVPGDVDLLICQKDYRVHLPENLKDRRLFLVDSLLDTQSYENLAKEFRKNKR